MASTSELRVFFTRSRCGAAWFLWGVALSAFAWPAAFLALAGRVACSVFVDDRFAVTYAGRLVELWQRRGRAEWSKVARLEATEAVTLGVVRQQVSVSAGGHALHVGFRTPWEARRAAATLTRVLQAQGLLVCRDSSSVVASARPTLDTRAPVAEWTSLGSAVAAAVVLWIAAGPIGILAIVISLAALVLRLLSVATTGSLAR